MNNLFDMELDRDATCDKVSDFLSKDFNRYLNYSGKHRTDLSSPLLDPTGVAAHDGRNHEEEKAVINVDAANCVEAINDAINDCSNGGHTPYATILFKKFVQRQPDWQIYGMLDYGKSRYYSLLKNALCEFAERIDYWKKADHAAIKDLRVFKKVDI